MAWVLPTGDTTGEWKERGRGWQGKGSGQKKAEKRKWLKGSY